MTQETMSGGTDANSVRKVMSVQAPPEVAWRVFTEKMGTWWPLGVYKIGKARAVELQDAEAAVAGSLGGLRKLRFGEGPIGSIVRGAGHIGFPY